MAKTKTLELDENGHRKFGLRDKLAYGAGDFGCNMSFALKSYLTIYWTQYMGIDSILLASLLLLVQVWDAINDPLIGAMVDADKRKYKRNKFLAYIWAGSIGLLVAGALCYMPFKNAPSMVKNILFVAGYMIWDAFYTVANVPYGSMLSLITDDPVERTGLSTFRSAGSMAASVLTGIVIPMVIYDSDSNLRGEYMFGIALIMGVLGFICFQFMIRNTEIRVDTDVKVSEEKKEDTQKFNFFTSVGHFFRNRAAVGATISPMATFIGMYGATTAVTVMFQSYFNMAQYSGLISMISYAGVFLWMPFAGKLVNRIGKKEAVTIGAIIDIFAYVLMMVLPITPDGKGLAMYVVCQVIAMLGGGINSCVSWTLMADAMDYEEWKFGTRSEGTTYAIHSFFRKLAQGVGPSLGLVLCVWLGYDETLGAAQTAQTASNMRYLVAACYLFSAVVQLIALGLVYNLDKKTVAQMTAELDERHAAAKAEAEAKAAAEAQA